MLDDTYTTAPLKFTVTVKADTIVTFESHWGVLVDPYIKEKANITVRESQIDVEYDNVAE